MCTYRDNNQRFPPKNPFFFTFCASLAGHVFPVLLIRSSTLSPRRKEEKNDHNHFPYQDLRCELSNCAEKCSFSRIRNNPLAAVLIILIYGQTRGEAHVILAFSPPLFFDCLAGRLPPWPFSMVFHQKSTIFAVWNCFFMLKNQQNHDTAVLFLWVR